MKRFFSLVSMFLLAAGLYASGCEITTEYPEMDSTPQPTLCDSDSDCLEGVCDAQSGTCVECLASDQCPVGKFCSPASNQCVTCFADSQCPTGVCDEAAGICRECQNESDCSSGQCELTSGICIECGSNADCVTSNPCQVGVCVAGRCSYGDMPEGLLCDDGDACTQGDYCVSGKCAGGQPIPDCGVPPDPCSELDAAGAMAMLPGTPCDDGNPCTLDDYCYMGKCVGDTISPECTQEDLDGDGYSTDAGDCNDLDATVNPGLKDLCDYIDNNCDGQVDEGCVGECVVTGCSGELCLDSSMLDKPSDCMWLPEYECLQFTTCGPYAPGGVCGWVKTPEYVECLNSLQTPCTENGICPDGTICDPSTGVCTPYVVPCYSDADCGYMEYCINGQCSPYTSECKDLGGVDFGGCEMVIGVAYQFGKCTFISGCGCDEYCGLIFQSIEECEAACGMVSPCSSNMDCGYGQVCMNGQCVYPELCEEAGGKCMYGDFTQPTCPADMYASPLAGCDMGICCMPGGCTGTYEICNGIDDDCDGVVDNGVCGECDDGNPCTEEFVAADGSCYSKEISCEDGDPCSYDYCDPDMGGCFSEWLPDCGGYPCASNADCPAGMVCMAGLCTAVTTSCFADNQCPAGSYCYFSSCGIDTGTCTAVPGACDMMFKPVCACNGLTYGNLCVLMQSKQDLAYEGNCQSNPVDKDGDGFATGVDCDDSNPATHPGAVDLCDGLDNDCDGIVDENCGSTPCNADSDCKAWQACMNGVCIDMPD